jgi:hypothetical protein
MRSLVFCYAICFMHRCEIYLPVDKNVTIERLPKFGLHSVSVAFEIG